LLFARFPQPARAVSSRGALKVSVLLALLNRPDFSPAAKVALRGQVDRLSFDSDKITVLKALSAK
jgi:hypothetical protein